MIFQKRFPYITEILNCFMNLITMLRYFL